MKKLLSLFFVVLFLCSLSLPFSAETDAEILWGQLSYKVPFESYGSEEITVEGLRSGMGAGSYSIMILRTMQKNGTLVPPSQEASSPRLEDNPDAPRIPKAAVVAAAEELFGKGAFDLLADTTYLTDSTNILYYDQATESYAYVFCSFAGQGDPAGRQYITPLNAREDGDVLRIEVASIWYSEAISGKYTLYYWMPDTGEAPLAQGKDWANPFTAKTSVYARMTEGVYDEYLPVYEHVFRKDETGMYYWESCKRVRGLLEIPQELLALPAQSTESTDSSTETEPSDTSSTTDGNHTVLGGNWGSTAQPSTETQTADSEISSATLHDPLVPAPSSPLLPIVVGVVLVGGIAVLSVFLLHKKMR